MERQQSVPYVLFVRRQNYVPTYFTQCDSQLNGENEDYKHPSASDAEINKVKDECNSSSRQISKCSAIKRSDSEPVIRTNPNSTKKIYTTLTLGSAQAKNFSCNINKMSFGLQRDCICDGVYGCPEDDTAKKAESLKKGRPICRVPWKRRSNGVQSKNHKKKPVQAPTKPVVKANGYYTSKNDMKAKEITKPAGHMTSMNSPLSHAVSCSSRNARGLKIHPGMFYSYGVMNGFHYRTACLPKRRSCDGYFGCCEEHKSSATGKVPQGQKQRETSSFRTIMRNSKKK